MALVIYLIAITYKVHIVVLRQTYGELRDSSIVQFRNDFERFGKFEYKVAARDAVFTNGSIISFRAYSDDESKIKSSNFDVGLLVQAEELPHPVFLQVLGRLSGNGIPKPLLLTEGNPSDSWCKERYVERTSKEIEDDGILFIQGTTYDNQTNIPKTYIQDLLTQYPQDYIDRYVFGNWDKTSDRVYSALADHHYIEPIKIHKHYHRAIGLDYGVTSDTAIVYVYKDEHENVIVWDEWRKPKATLEDIYRACNKYGPLPVVADTNIKNNVLRDNQFGSIWGDLSAMGLRLIAAQKGDKNANILLVNQYLHQNRLHFFNHCEYTIKQHKRYQYKRDSEEVVKKDDHSVDALQYVLRYLDKIQVKGPINVYGPRPRGPTLKDYTVRK